jgi:hypothetical protein
VGLSGIGSTGSPPLCSTGCESHAVGMIPMRGPSRRVLASEWVGCLGSWARGLDPLHLVD